MIMQAMIKCPHQLMLRYIYMNVIMLLFLSTRKLSGDLRQGSSNNSVTNFVQGFPYVFQREKQPSFEDLLLVVLVILTRTSATRF